MAREHKPECFESCWKRAFWRWLKKCVEWWWVELWCMEWWRVRWWRVRWWLSRSGQSGSRGPTEMRRRGSKRDSDSEGGGGGDGQRTVAEAATMNDVSSGGGTVTWDGGNLFVGSIELFKYLYSTPLGASNLASPIWQCRVPWTAQSTSRASGQSTMYK